MKVNRLSLSFISLVLMVVFSKTIRSTHQKRHKYTQTSSAPSPFSQLPSQWPFDLSGPPSRPDGAEYWSINSEYLNNSFLDLIKVNGCVPDASDPDTTRNVSEVIISRGFAAEEHEIVTEDGYIINCQRIINPLARDRKLRPIILQHGLMSSSIDWVINSKNVRPALWPETAAYNYANSTGGRGDEDVIGDTQDHPNSLGFYLSNRGYDVFLSNSRGNVYGQRHVNMSAREPRFWDFCFDEKIRYDLPAIIRYVQRLTNHTKLAYVGHSQGAEMMFGLLADQPEFADQIEPFIAFAPVAFVESARTPFKRFEFLAPYLRQRNAPFTVNRALVALLAAQVCNRKVIQKEICANVLFLMVGFDESEFDAERLPAYLCHMPSGTSFRNMVHYGQEVESGRFAHFDFGLDANMAKYRRPRPPDYDLGAIRSKSMVFFTADNDWLASPKDVARLLSSLRTKPYAVINMTEIWPPWNHIDFVYAKRAGKLINTRVIQILREFQ